jgi:hypothetical protein
VKAEDGQWPTLDWTKGPRPPKPAKQAEIDNAAAAGTSTEPPATTVEGTSAAAPTAAKARPKAYASNKDWDKVSSDITKELDAEKPEG